MAGIDKIYGTQEQYLEFKKWLLENQKPIKCRNYSTEGPKYEMEWPSEFLYDEDWDESDIRPISNFPEAVDKWLMKNCPLEFIQKRLKEQYGE